MGAPVQARALLSQIEEGRRKGWARPISCALAAPRDDALMTTPTRRESIEAHLTESQELDQETYEHLAETAGLLAEAEASFVRLAEAGWSA